MGWSVQVALLFIMSSIHLQCGRVPTNHQSWSPASFLYLLSASPTFSASKPRMASLLDFQIFLSANSLLDYSIHKVLSISQQTLRRSFQILIFIFMKVMKIIDFFAKRLIFRKIFAKLGKFLRKNMYYFMKSYKNLLILLILVFGFI